MARQEIWLFKQEDPNNPAWCPAAQMLVDWATDKLMEPIAQDPTRPKIFYAQGRLSEVYRRFYDRADSAHQASAREADHPCLHRAYLELSQQLDDLELLAPIPELEPPAPAEITLPGNARVSPEDHGPSVEEESGIPFGEYRDVAVDEEEDKSP